MSSLVRSVAVTTFPPFCMHGGSVGIAAASVKANGCGVMLEETGKVTGCTTVGDGVSDGEMETCGVLVRLGFGVAEDLGVS